MRKALPERTRLISRRSKTLRRARHPSPLVELRLTSRRRLARSPSLTRAVLRRAAHPFTACSTTPTGASTACSTGPSLRGTTGWVRCSRRTSRASKRARGTPSLSRLVSCLVRARRRRSSLSPVRWTPAVYFCPTPTRRLALRSCGRATAPTAPSAAPTTSWAETAARSHY